jgi:hypothetical protein
MLMCSFDHRNAIYLEIPETNFWSDVSVALEAAIEDYYHGEIGDGPSLHSRLTSHCRGEG